MDAAEKQKALKDKKKRSFRKLPSKKSKQRVRGEGLRTALSKDEGELIKNITAGNNFVAESGRMVGCQEDKITFFEAEDFDLDHFVEAQLNTLKEKGVGILKVELAALQERCEDEAQNAIHGSYALFVDACNGVAEMDAQFQHLRVLVASTASLANELKRAVQPNTSRPMPESGDAGLLTPSRELSNTLNIRVMTALENMDVAIAERDFGLAKKLLMEMDKELKDDDSRNDLSLECAVDERRQTIVQLLESQLQDLTLGANDQHTLLQTLSSVAGDVHALNFLLSLHSAQISNDLQQLPKPHRTGESESEGADYSGSLSQCSFHGIGLAVDDFRSVFGSSSAAPLCSILSQWAEAEAKKCAEIIQTHALSAFAGLSSMVHSVSMSLVYAEALKNAHAIDVVSAIRKVFWPSVESLIDKFFVTTGDEITVMVREEMSVLFTTSSPWDRHASPSNRALMDSAQLIVDRIRYLCAVLRALWTSHIRSALRTGIRSLCDAFVETLIADVRDKVADGVAVKIIERVSEWLMTVIAHLLEDLVPKELSPIEDKIGTLFTRNEIQTMVNRAAQGFGLEQVSNTGSNGTQQ